MSPPPPPKSPGVGVGDPLPVVGSNRSQTPVDGGEFLDLLLYRLIRLSSTGQRSSTNPIHTQTILILSAMQGHGCTESITARLNYPNSGNCKDLDLSIIQAWMHQTT
jgi:hypothetical protein